MVQNLRSRLIQPTATSSRVLSWPRSFGLGLSKPRLTLDVKVFVQTAVKRCPRHAVRKCCACSVFNYIPDLHGWETRAAVAGKWPAARENSKFCLNNTSSICIPGTSLSNHSIDRWRTFRRGFRQVSQQRNANLERKVNLQEKKITLGTTTNYVIIGPVWPRTKPWTIYTSSSRLM